MDTTSTGSRLRADLHFRVRRLLQEMSHREPAEAVGISLGRIHSMFRALVEKGHVKLGNFTAAKDKRRYAYVLTPKGLARKAAMTGAFLARKMEEYEALKAEIEGLSAELDGASASKKP